VRFLHQLKQVVSTHVLMTAGRGGVEATEGLRRMRELRDSGLRIMKRLYARRRWQYRIKGEDDDEETVQEVPEGVRAGGDSDRGEQGGVVSEMPQRGQVG